MELKNLLTKKFTYCGYCGCIINLSEFPGYGFTTQFECPNCYQVNEFISDYEYDTEDQAINARDSDI